MITLSCHVSSCSYCISFKHQCTMYHNKPIQCCLYVITMQSTRPITESRRTQNFSGCHTVTFSASGSVVGPEYLVLLLMVNQNVHNLCPHSLLCKLPQCMMQMMQKVDGLIEQSTQVESPDDDLSQAHVIFPSTFLCATETRCCCLQVVSKL